LADLGERDAELAVAMTGRDVRMRSRVEIGIDAQADRRLNPEPLRDRGDAAQLGTRLDVDHQDIGFERSFDLVVGLADARKDDLAWIGARLETSHPLAGRNYIAAGAQIGEKLEHA